MKKAYITRAVLKDYLTIKNVDITFNEGINIIIGKNGTGKTNFLDYLKDSLQVRQLKSYNFSKIDFIFFGEKYCKATVKTSYLADDNLNIEENYDIRVYKNGEIVNDIKFLSFVDAVKINHAIPEPNYIVKEPLNDNIKKNLDSLSVFPSIKRNRIADIIGLNYVTEILMSDIPSEHTLNDFLERIRVNLFNYSNIKGVRIGQNSKVERISENETYFSNLYLEYFVNSEWLLFDQLSDGTKRLFYIISEVEYSKSSIILLEEPELGLHPHQLYRLMDFIKEKSENFQFIITTHSPMVLNTLNSDELNNIIISKIENGETKLQHLSPEQIEKAKVYMEELDLSDYWIHSDLED